MIWKAIGWGIAAIIALTVLSMLFSLIVGIVGFALSLASTAIGLALVGAVIYGFLKIGGSLIGGRNKNTQQNTTEFSGQATTEEELREQYVNGEITEAEYERQLDKLMGTDEKDWDSMSLDTDKELDIIKD